jgi:hypothetical protein
MRTGKDDQDTHESMQINRHKRKYTSQDNRHAGQNRLKHRDRDNKTGEKTEETTDENS